MYNAAGILISQLLSVYYIILYIISDLEIRFCIVPDVVQVISFSYLCKEQFVIPELEHCPFCYHVCHQAVTGQRQCAFMEQFGLSVLSAVSSLYDDHL